MKKSEIERRLVALEKDVAELKRHFVAPWWQVAVGAFEKDPYFERAMRIGAQYRKSVK
jgi:hypothetical protein